MIIYHLSHVHAIQKIGVKKNGEKKIEKREETAMKSEFALFELIFRYVISLVYCTVSLII